MTPFAIELALKQVICDRVTLNWRKGPQVANNGLQSTALINNNHFGFFFVFHYSMTKTNLISFYCTVVQTLFESFP